MKYVTDLIHKKFCNTYVINVWMFMWIYYRLKTVPRWRNQWPGIPIKDWVNTVGYCWKFPAVLSRGRSKKLFHSKMGCCFSDGNWSKLFVVLCIKPILCLFVEEMIDIPDETVSSHSPSEGPTQPVYPEDAVSIDSDKVSCCCWGYCIN